jgi:OmpA-OmpF porin, OOP family
MSTIIQGNQPLLNQVIALIPDLTKARFADQIGLNAEQFRHGLTTALGKLITVMEERQQEPDFQSTVSKLIPRLSESQAVQQMERFNPSQTIDNGLEQLAQQLLGTVFGSRLDSVYDGIAMTSRISHAASAALLNVASAALLSFLGQQGINSLWGAAGAANVGLNAAKPNATLMAGAATSGLRTADLRSQQGQTHNNEKKRGGLLGWIIPILLGALAIWGLMNLWPKAQAPQTTSSATTYMSTEPVMSFNNVDLGRLIQVTLPSGLNLTIPERGVENQLIGFIQDDARIVDKNTWFDFDRILFDTGKATLKPASNQQLDNIAAILNAYPNAHLKIGGYTDNTGNATLNQALSSQRAVAVMNHLTGLGVANTRLKAEGYGDQFPVASNDTPEGRAQNRRIAVRVTQK